MFSLLKKQKESSRIPVIRTDYHKAPSLATIKGFRLAHPSTRKPQCARGEILSQRFSNPLTFSRGGWHGRAHTRGTLSASICHYGRFVLVRTEARPSGPRYDYGTLSLSLSLFVPLSAAFPSLALPKRGWRNRRRAYI